MKKFIFSKTINIRLHVIDILIGIVGAVIITIFVVTYKVPRDIYWLAMMGGSFVVCLLIGMVEIVKRLDALAERKQEEDKKE